MDDHNKNLGLKVGLEVHQELATSHKLFCSCSPLLFHQEAQFTFIRRLRPTQSELGKIDPAALFEFQQGKTLLYESSDQTDCLVEMDEEPPGPLNAEAVDICLTVGLIVGARPVDEIHVMRKIVIDGSNTTGFQRTCVVALGGEIIVDGKRVGIEQICLEEDAARKTEESGSQQNYRIDRLGIPLVEVSTEPTIGSPEEAAKVALAIGRILRSTGKVRRGLGSIRQDVNISITEGALVEIKGIQQLDLISKVVEYEVLRQRKLLEIRDKLRSKGASVDYPVHVIDVTELFRETECQILKTSIRKGERICAARLPFFAGLVGMQLCPGRRLGTEMADRAKFWGRVKGIFHTDELPGYGITDEEVSLLRESVEAKAADAVVIVAGEPEKCKGALNAVFERASEALTGVPSETRGPNADGTTHFMRPRPGAARMYPETDVVPIGISNDRLKKIGSALPESLDVQLKGLMQEFGLNSKLAGQLMDSDYLPLFRHISRGTKASPSLVAVTLTETLKSLERESLNVDALTDERIEEVFRFLEQGLVVKESVPDILTWLATNPRANTNQAIKELKLELLSQEELWQTVQIKVRENLEVARRAGARASGMLMGIVMKEIRGRAKTENVLALVQKALEEMLESR